LPKKKITTIIINSYPGLVHIKRPKVCMEASYHQCLNSVTHTPLCCCEKLPTVISDIFIDQIIALLEIIAWGLTTTRITLKSNFVEKKKKTLTDKTNPQT